MKNGTWRVVAIMLLLVGALLALRFLPPLEVEGVAMRRVDVLSDVRLPDTTGLALLADSLPPLPEPVATVAKKDSLPCPPDFVPILDYGVETQRGMQPFYRALSAVNELGRPVRIAYFGDSFIEGDILTGDLRRLLQQKYGGHGTGFVEIAPLFPGIRNSVRQLSDGWETHSITDPSDCVYANLGIAQRYSHPLNGAYTEAFGVKRARLDTFEVATLFLKSRYPISVRVRVNGQSAERLSTAGTGALETLRKTGRMGRVRWSTDSCGSAAVFYGMALEGHSGVTLDNFALRGSGGATLRSIPQNHLTQFAAVRPYDLIVLQFGLNVASKNQLDYSGYVQQMSKVIGYLKTAFPTAGILIVGVGDRQGKLDDGELHTLPGVKALLRYQQRLAADEGVAFWSLYDAMGGEGGIKRMAEQTPAEANKDYTHINRNGGRRLAELLFKAMEHGKKQNE